MTDHLVSISSPLDAPGQYDIAYTPPPGYALSTTCTDLGVLDPTGRPDPYSLGENEVGMTGSLPTGLCAANPFYLGFDLEPGDPFIINNNIPLMCPTFAPPTEIPTVSEWGMILLALLLAACGGVFLIRRRMI